MVDTKVQHHINAIVAGSWPRCRDVILRGDVLHCTLDYSQSYGLVEAYKYDPHIRFANAKTEQDLIAFIRAWGPPFVNPETSGMMFLSLERAVRCNSGSVQFSICWPRSDVPKASAKRCLNSLRRNTQPFVVSRLRWLSRIRFWHCEMNFTLQEAFRSGSKARISAPFELLRIM